jgi:hypothetical protein
MLLPETRHEEISSMHTKFAGQVLSTYKVSETLEG